MRRKQCSVWHLRIVICFSVISIIAVLAFACLLFSGSAAKADTAPDAPTYKYYTSVQVRKGDTLWGIANAYITEDCGSMRDYIKEICSLNHITEGDIHAGQYITIPYYSEVYLE